MTATVFVTLEGIEGVGKSSAVACVVAWLQARGQRVLDTREPGGTVLGERVRALVLANDGGTMAPVTELLLMFAARAQHLDEVIRPALADGTCVVCDRFTDATYAYQGGGRGLPQDLIRAAENLVHGDLQPGLTILLDAPPALALGRARARSATDRFEREQLDFFARARAAYLDRAARDPVRFLVIDASADLNSVHASIRRGLDQRLA